MHSLSDGDNLSKIDHFISLAENGHSESLEFLKINSPISYRKILNCFRDIKFYIENQPRSLSEQLIQIIDYFISFSVSESSSFNENIERIYYNAFSLQNICDALVESLEGGISFFLLMKYFYL
jgi:hypothetical protein